jgi:hypothetical protein
VAAGWWVGLGARDVGILLWDADQDLKFQMAHAQSVAVEQTGRRVDPLPVQIRTEPAPLITYHEAIGFRQNCAVKATDYQARAAQVAILRRTNKEPGVTNDDVAPSPAPLSRPELAADDPKLQKHHAMPIMHNLCRGKAFRIRHDLPSA